MGFAFAQTNTGHDARQEPGASFVLSDPQKAVDYAYRAVHLTTVTAKSITAQYYAKPVARSYWNSCSNGGRQGLIEAQRYPRDFDGVIVNAPWVDQTGFTIGALWNQRALDGSSLTPAKLALLSGKVMEKCDAVMKIYTGPQSRGKALFPGYMPGSEAMVSAVFGAAPASAWVNFIVAAEPRGSAADFNLAEDTMRYLVFSPPKPDYDYRTFDFDHDTQLLDTWGRQANAKNADLSELRSRGGKLLMTYGWADQVLQPQMGVNYYEQAIARNGPRTTDFFRLFMVPGMTHCSGGIGTDRFDPVTAMIDWVEGNAAPDSLHASRVVDNRVVRSRPLCPSANRALFGQGQH